MELKIEYLSPSELVPYENNAKRHPAEQIEQIKESIKEFGFNDPIAIGEGNVVIEGHGRLIAATEMELEKVPVIRLNELTEEQRKAYTLVHNKLTMNSGFDFSMLSLELSDLKDTFDMSQFGFGDFEMDNLGEEFEPEPYDKEIENEYGENGLIAYNVIISCLNEEEQLWLKELLREEGRLQRLYDCSVIRARFEE